MATRDELYAKFGITAEAAQLFETELGTLLLGARGLKDNWHIAPDREAGLKLLTEIDESTLGSLLRRLKGVVDFDADLQDRLLSALKVRNRLFHGFFERHNFKIQTDEGRDIMIRDLETMHDKLFIAWQMTGQMTRVLINFILEQQSKTKGKGD